MKKFFYILIIIALTFSVGCKKDKNENVLTPKQDTIVYPGYEEYYSDESDLDDSVEVKDNVVDDVNTDVMIEDTVGNVKPADDVDLSQPGKSFYIIVGSFQNLTNAQKRAEYFKKIGYTAEVLPKFGTYNRVSVAKFNDESSARTELKTLRKKFSDNSYWLLYR